MKIERGMYVRTKKGIGKIDDTRMFMDKYFEFHLDSNKGMIHNVPDNTYWNSEKDIIGEPSFNVIDVIDERDLVNGIWIEKNNGRYLETLEIDPEQSSFGYAKFLELWPNDIYDVITHEQYDAMKYTIGE